MTEPQPLPAPERSGLRYIATGIVALLVVLGVVVYAVSGDDSPARPEPAVTSSTFILNGELRLASSGTFRAGRSCTGKDPGYADIHTGSAVVVYDADGTVVAKGVLSSGTLATDDAFAPCVFPFVVGSVPKTGDYLQVEVSHRGKVVVTEADAVNGSVALTLG